MHKRIPFGAPRTPVRGATTCGYIANSFRCVFARKGCVQRQFVGALLYRDRRGLSHLENSNLDLRVRTVLGVFLTVTFANRLDLRCQDQLKRTKSRHVALRYKMRIRVVGLVADVIRLRPEVIHLSECFERHGVSSCLQGHKNTKHTFSFGGGGDGLGAGGFGPGGHHTSSQPRTQRLPLYWHQGDRTKAFLAVHHGRRYGGQPHSRTLQTAFFASIEPDTSASIVSASAFL